MNQDNLQIVMSPASRDSFLAMLDANDIAYHRHPRRLGIGGEAVEIVDILNALGTASIIPSLAVVAVQWLKARSSRKLVLQTKAGDLVQIEGHSLKEAMRLLESATSMRALDVMTDDMTSEQGREE